jgi:hypothetical protein
MKRPSRDSILVALALAAAAIYLCVFVLGWLLGVARGSWIGF